MRPGTGAAGSLSGAVARRVREVGSIQGDWAGTHSEADGSQFSSYWGREVQIWKEVVRMSPVGQNRNRRCL